MPASNFRKRKNTCWHFMFPNKIPLNEAVRKCQKCLFCHLFSQGSLLDYHLPSSFDSMFFDLIGHKVKSSLVSLKYFEQQAINSLDNENFEFLFLSK